MKTQKQMKKRLILGLILLFGSMVANYYYPFNWIVYIVFLVGGVLTASNVLYFFRK